MKTKFKSQRKGADLMTVTVVSAMMVVIIIAATQLVAQTTNRTNKEYRKKQAYYVASSCLRAFVNETTGQAVDATHTDADIMAMIKRLQNVADTGEIPVKIESINTDIDDVGTASPRWKNASCTLRVEKVNGNEDYLKVIATGSYLGQTKQVVAYLTCQPLRSHSYTPKALEIIGTSGGISDRFNNIQVYGAAGATDQASHDNNTAYKFNHNQNKIFGDTDINGSIAIQNTNYFKSNPYYCEGVDESKGCVLNVSRSLIVNANEPRFEPSFSKSLTKDDLNPRLQQFNYNYVNVLEAMVVGGTNVNFGVDTDFAVDVYTSYLYIGDQNHFDSNMVDAMTETCPDKNKYWSDMMQAGWAQGDGNNFRGKVYVYNQNDAFNGDMEIAGINNNFYGDIYIDGDLYIADNVSLETQLNIQGTVHLMPKKKDGTLPHIYRGSRQYNGTKVITPANNIDNEFKAKFNVKNDEDWHGYARATRPLLPVLEEKPYYYYPEHLLCLDNSTVTNISSTYKELYLTSGTGKDELNTDKCRDVRSSEFSNRNEDGSYKRTFGDESDNGAVFKPDFIVTDNCYIDRLDNQKILIDLDTAKKDIIVVLKNGGETVNQNVILVKNEDTNPDKSGARFCYFVSDSGVGNVEDQYSSSGEVSQYDHKTFRQNPTFTFGGSNAIVMDLQSFLHCNVYTDSAAKGNGGSLNPTSIKDDQHPGYQLKSNYIVFLITEGGTLTCNQNTLLEASVYMPRAKYVQINKGAQCQIDPYFTDSNIDALVVIGNLICNEYEVSGNVNTIVYNEVSPYSILASVKGSGEEHASKSFMLKNYAAK